MRFKRTLRWTVKGKAFIERIVNIIDRQGGNSLAGERSDPSTRDRQQGVGEGALKSPCDRRKKVSSHLFLYLSDSWAGGQV